MVKNLRLWQPKRKHTGTVLNSKMIDHGIASTLKQMDKKVKIAEQVTLFRIIENNYFKFGLSAQHSKSSLSLAQ